MNGKRLIPWVVLLAVALLLPQLNAQYRVKQVALSASVSKGTTQNIKFIASAGEWMAGEASGGAYVANLGFVTAATVLTGLEEKEGGDRALPIAFDLFQNFPNPFNPATIIRYDIPVASQVTLTVFNTLGQRTADLVDERKEPGYHEISFDGSRLASGVYFYRLHARPIAGGQAGGYSSIKKLLLVK